MSERVYEEERLLLHVQEALAEAIERGGLTQADVTRRVGIARSGISQVLSGTGSRGNPTLETIASIAHAAGFRLVVTLERLEGE